MRSKTIIALGLIGLGVLAGCGDGGNTALTTVPTAHLAISLPATTVAEGTPFTFTVTALDATNAVIPTYVGMVQITTSDPSATLPAAAALTRGAGQFTVTFKTSASQTITASDTVGDASPGTSAAIAVTVAVTVSISPTVAKLNAGEMQTFAATVTGSSNTAVVWSVQEGAAGGSITSAGVFTAPQTAGTYHVIATSAADSTKSATAVVTVPPPVQGVPVLDDLFPSCVPAGEQFIDGVDTNLTVVVDNFTAGAVVRWNGSDRPTTGNGTINALVAQISAADIATAGTAAVTVFNPGSDGGSSNALTFTITAGAGDPVTITTDPTGHFAYVVDIGCGGGGYVSMYTINPTTGALTSIGPPEPTFDDSPYAGSLMSVTPSGKFAYVINEGDSFDYPDSPGSIAIYSIDANTGALTSAGAIEANCPGLCLPTSVVVDPSGKFAYVTNGGAGGQAFNVAMYSINATSGALTSIGTIATGSYPADLATDPSGNFVYVVNQNLAGTGGTVSSYSIDISTGALTSTGMIAAGTDPAAIAVDPAGGFLYVANPGSGDVSMYSINPTTGALTSMGTIAAGDGPTSIAVDPAGKFAYTANNSSNDVSMYTIDPTSGALTSIGTAAAGTNPTSIAIPASGQVVYVTNAGSNNVSVYTIGTTGTLTLIGTVGT